MPIDPFNDEPFEIDVKTRNWDLHVLEGELHKYSPGSPESIALWKLKEALIADA